MVVGGYIVEDLWKMKDFRPPEMKRVPTVRVVDDLGLELILLIFVQPWSR